MTLGPHSLAAILQVPFQAWNVLLAHVLVG